MLTAPVSEIITKMTEEEIKKKVEKLVEHADVHKKDESINAEELEWIQVFLIGMIKGLTSRSKGKSSVDIFHCYGN